MDRINNDILKILKPGDTIKGEKDEIIDLMYALAEEGIETDFEYEVDGVRGYYLKIIRTEAML